MFNGLNKNYYIKIINNLQIIFFLFNLLASIIINIYDIFNIPIIINIIIFIFLILLE